MFLRYSPTSALKPSAIEAERGGADRLEIARSMEVQGLTPPVSLVRDIAAAVRIPVRVMIREHDGFECSSAQELAAMREAAEELERIDRVEGLVLGFTRNGGIDHDTLASILGAATRLRATFHRAFDSLRDPLTAVVDLKRHRQIDRILSGGGNGTWRERCDRLAALARLTQPEIRMLPGGGVDRNALREISHTPGLTEAHVGRAVRVPAEVWGRVSARLVRQLRDD
jgi:copper homeostasis protein